MSLHCRQFLICLSAAVPGVLYQRMVLAETTSPLNSAYFMILILWPGQVTKIFNCHGPDPKLFVLIELKDGLKLHKFCLFMLGISINNVYQLPY